MANKYTIRSLDGAMIIDPCAVLRAQDRYSTYALAGYIKFLENTIHYNVEYIQEMKGVLYDMMYWQAVNPDKIKNPD